MKLHSYFFNRTILAACTVVSVACSFKFSEYFVLCLADEHNTHLRDSDFQADINYCNDYEPKDIVSVLKYSYKAK